MFSFVGYEFHLDSALVKPSQERWLKFQDLFLQLKSKHFFDYKMFDVTNWVACLNRENGPGWTPSHEALSVSPQGALEISSVVRQPPSLDKNFSAHLEWWQSPTNVMKGTDLISNSLQMPQMNAGRSLRANLYKDLWSDRGIRLPINVLEPKVFSLALQRLKDQCLNKTIIDTLGPTGLHISQSSDLNRLLSSFTGVFPKVPGIFLKGTFLLFNGLTKAPFEPMTDLKHLTLKTAFLLALASGKHRSKIHALVANKYLI